MMKTLRELYQEHDGKVSDKWDIYLEEYERIFAPYRDKEVSLLEIGVQNGGSLEIWQKYFPNAVSLIGCDINEKCRNLEFNSNVISVVVGDANNVITESEIKGINKDFDIIIDDGSHTSGDIVKSFAKYFPYLNEGGVFVAEDLHCSYWAEFDGGLYSQLSSINFFKQLSDITNFEHWGTGQPRREAIDIFRDAYSIDLSEEALASIHSVEFVNSMCVVRKLSADQNELGPRNVAGNQELVVPGHKDLEGERNKALCQRTNPESRVHPYNQVLSLRSESDRLSRLLQEREQELSIMKRSRSWRVTAPLRRAISISHTVRKYIRLPFVAVNLTGGPVQVFRKALNIYRTEGAGGLRRRCGFVATRLQQGSHLHAQDYEEWIRRYETMTGSERDRIRAEIDRFEKCPTISIIMPVYNPEISWLKDAINSVKSQFYQDWELCIADDHSTDPDVKSFLKVQQESDSRIKVEYRPDNGHISAASNSGLSISNGSWVVLLDQDDLLTPNALYEIARVINENDKVNLIYSDEDKVDEEGVRKLPLFKPGWSPHLALSQAYIGHLCAIRKEVVVNVGGFDEELSGSQDHDLWLKVAAKSCPDQIVHIPKVLYHWRMHNESTSKTSISKPYAWDAAVLAAQRYVNDRYHGSEIRVVKGEYPFTLALTFPKLSGLTASIIIPTRDGVELLEKCVAGILEKTSFTNYEIIIVDNGSIDAKTTEYFNEIVKLDARVRVIPADIEFNWSRLNNIACREANGDVFVFLNNDTDVVNSDWLTCLLGYASMPDTGVVGGLLLFEDGSIQHSGVVVGMGGWADHVYRTCQPDHYAGWCYVSPVLTRNALAVTGACMAITKEKFNKLGGFDEQFMICGSDVELCIRAYKSGYYNVVCSQAMLYHYESKTRSPDVPRNDFDQSSLKYEPYRTQCIDPFYNPNLSLQSTTPRLSD